VKKPVRLNTELGPLEVDVIYCDGVDCRQKGLEAYLPGWYVLEPFGVSISTFGDAMFAETTHWCSKECLKKAL